MPKLGAIETGKTIVPAVTATAAAAAPNEHEQQRQGDQIAGT